MQDIEEPAAVGETAATDTSAPRHHQPLETWVVSKQTPGWLLAAARVLHRWPTGKELSEEQFEAGLKAARELVLR